MEPGSRDELIYLAGFFDGEGCVHIGRDNQARNSHGARHQIVIQVAQTSRFPLDRYLARWGGSSFHRTVPIKPRYNLVWAWRLWERKATARFCQEILPFIILKKPQLELCLEFHETTLIRYGQWNPMPRAVWEERERLYLRCMALKKDVPGRN